MKTIRIVTSPKTEYKLIEERSVFAPNDQVYVMLDGESLFFAKTQEQSKAYIEKLEKMLAEANGKLEELKNILWPTRYDESDEEV
jgi:hypothetical protein